MGGYAWLLTQICSCLVNVALNSCLRVKVATFYINMEPFKYFHGGLDKKSARLRDSSKFYSSKVVFLNLVLSLVSWFKAVI
jgi:hypothetical protein